jgi:hypothetical protein
MTRKRKKPTREELEESAERICREVAQHNREGVAAFFACSSKAISEALVAAEKALRAGEPIEQVETTFSFVTDAGLAEAAGLLPVYYFDVSEFEKMPVITDFSDPVEAPEGWSKFQCCGKWIAIFTNAGGGALAYRPELEEAAPLNERLS